MSNTDKNILIIVFAFVGGVGTITYICNGGGVFADILFIVLIVAFIYLLLWLINSRAESNTPTKIKVGEKNLVDISVERKQTLLAMTKLIEDCIGYLNIEILRADMQDDRYELIAKENTHLIYSQKSLIFHFHLFAFDNNSENSFITIRCDSDILDDKNSNCSNSFNFTSNTLKDADELFKALHEAKAINLIQCKATASRKWAEAAMSKADF